MLETAPTLRTPDGAMVAPFGGRTPAQIMAEFADAMPPRAANTAPALIGYSRHHRAAVVRVWVNHLKHRQVREMRAYFLVGWDDRGDPFAHPVPADVVQAALRTDKGVEPIVGAVQRWVWGVSRTEFTSGRRWRDLLIVPAEDPRKGGAHGMVMSIGSRHRVKARRIVVVGTFTYALDPECSAGPDPQDTIRLTGWHTIREPHPFDPYRPPPPTKARKSGSIRPSRRRSGK